MEPQVVERGQPGWPARLEHLARPPDRLWSAGPVPTAHPAVAVVGSRRASLAGLEVARWLARELAALGVQVISGMARGIDGAAHGAAMDAGGSTVAVLGCGVDVCYPPEHAALRSRLLAGGRLISEVPPGTEPLGWHFPRRNRIIAALCCAVVVVEAGERSGALSTARHAADLGREVLAVPGPIRSPRSVGANRLIRDGAAPLLEIGDLLSAVPDLAGLRPAAGPRRARPGTAADAAAPLGRRILGLLAGGAAHPDDLGLELGAGAAEVGAELTALEVAGLVRSGPGGLVERSGMPR